MPILHCSQPDEGFRLAQIRNKAISAANGEYIIVIDGDMLLERGIIRGHKRAAWKGQFVQGSRVWLSKRVLVDGQTRKMQRRYRRFGNGEMQFNLSVRASFLNFFRDGQIDSKELKAAILPSGKQTV